MLCLFETVSETSFTSTGRCIIMTKSWRNSQGTNRSVRYSCPENLSIDLGLPNQKTKQGNNAFHTHKCLLFFSMLLILPRWFWPVQILIQLSVTLNCPNPEQNPQSPWPKRCLEKPVWKLYTAKLCRQYISIYMDIFSWKPQQNKHKKAGTTRQEALLDGTTRRHN